MYVHASIFCCQSPYQNSEHVLNLLTIRNKDSWGWLCVSQSQHLELKFFSFQEWCLEIFQIPLFMFMFLMLCEHMHWKVCRLTIFHFNLFLQFSVGIYHNISNTIQSLIVFFLCCIMIRLSVHKVSMHTPPPNENFCL